MSVARNLSTRYLAIAIEMLIGLVMLPFNVSHLGQAAYGLWVLTTSVTAYFSLLDLGYGGALVKFVAQYRAKHDIRALNEILSTTFFLFAAFGVATYLIAIGLAVYMDRIFHITPQQVHIGRIVLLVTTVNVAAGTAFSVFGAVINGFQRYDLNNLAGTACSIVVAVVNFVVLFAGYGLVTLVVGTTLVRVLTYAVYRANAYRVFPALELRFGLFTRARFREVTMVSVYMLLIDWANKLNFSVDALVIGVFLNTSAVAIWSVGQRLAETTQRLTNQLNEVLFPSVVDHDTSRRLDRLQGLFLVGTRLSLAAVIPLAGALMLMAGPLVHAWLGPAFADSALVVELLASTVILRVGDATASTVLRGAGQHRFLAVTNVVTALVNLLLSILLVSRLGLAGVAIGTLIPVGLAAVFVVFPAGCRRVQLSIPHVLAEAVWPAVWPAAVMAAYVWLTLPLIGPSLIAVGMEMLAAMGVYVVTFIAFGVSAVERRFYASKALQVTALLPLPTASGDV